MIDAHLRSKRAEIGHAHLAQVIDVQAVVILRERPVFACRISAVRDGPHGSGSGGCGVGPARGRQSAGSEGRCGGRYSLRGRIHLLFVHPVHRRIHGRLLDELDAYLPPRHSPLRPMRGREVVSVLRRAVRLLVAVFPVQERLVCQLHLARLLDGRLRRIVVLVIHSHVLLRLSCRSFQ